MTFRRKLAAAFVVCATLMTSLIAANTLTASAATYSNGNADRPESVPEDRCVKSETQRFRAYTRLTGAKYYCTTDETDVYAMDPADQYNLVVSGHMASGANYVVCYRTSAMTIKRDGVRGPLYPATEPGTSTPEVGVWALTLGDTAVNGSKAWGWIPGSKIAQADGKTLPGVPACGSKESFEGEPPYSGELKGTDLKAS